MSDDDKTPVDVPPLRAEDKPRRLQSQTDRDVEGMRAKKERERREVAVPIELPDEITGKHEGEELKMYRSKRPTEERIERLEDKHDALDAKHDTLASSVHKIDTNISEMRGEMKILPRLVDALEDAAKGTREREHVTLTAKVDVDRAQALDPIRAKEARRGWITAGIAIISTIAAGTLAIVQARGC